MVYSYPFPGSCVGVHTLGEMKKEYAEVLRKAVYDLSSSRLLLLSGNNLKQIAIS